MGIIIFFFIALLVPIFFISKNPKISLMQKSLMIFSVIVVSVGILCYVFITGFERGRDPKILDYEIESQNNDSLELQKLVRDVYKWRETENSKPDFDVYLNDKNDTIYAGLDSKMHKERLKELSKTNLFSQEFLDNYNKIATNIDEKMKKKSAIYYVGELPPFGNDANPWCNCQDNPDNYSSKNLISKEIMLILSGLGATILNIKPKLKRKIAFGKFPISKVLILINFLNNKRWLAFSSS